MSNSRRRTYVDEMSDPARTAVTSTTMTEAQWIDELMPEPKRAPPRLSPWPYFIYGALIGIVEVFVILLYYLSHGGF